MPSGMITKLHIAGALKELAKSRPYTKISIADIAERCAINRKTLYYHFADKNDLLAWVFFHECGDWLEKGAPTDFWEFYLRLVTCLQCERAFYLNVLKGGDGGVLKDVLKEYLKRNITQYVSVDYLEHLGPEKKAECIDFLCATFVASLEEWLTNHPDLSPEEYIEVARFDKLKSL